MRRRPQRPDRIVPPGWHEQEDDWDTDPPRLVTSTFGCALMALGLLALLLVVVVAVLVVAYRAAS